MYGGASNLELFVFVIIGVVCGLLGVLFVLVVDTISGVRNRILNAKKASAATVMKRKLLLLKRI